MPETRLAAGLRADALGAVGGGLCAAPDYLAVTRGLLISGAGRGKERGLGLCRTEGTEERWEGQGAEMNSASRGGRQSDGETD